MEKLLSIAKQILDENPNASLTGTLMLKLRGIDLGREPHDIDILICDNAPCIKFPNTFEVVKQIGAASDGSGAKYKYCDYVIDVLSCGEEPELVDGFRLGTIEGLINKKYIYSQQSNEESKKHHEDLDKMGCIFPKPEPTTHDELPF